MIEEAAAELFLEQSFAGTTVDEIANRAGVSRATFFNYFNSKGDLLWIDADQAINELEERILEGLDVVEAIRQVSRSITQERVPLSLSQSEVMGTEDEVFSSGLARVARLSGVLRQGLARRAGGLSSGLERAVQANSLTGAVVAAWGSWVFGGVSRQPLEQYVNHALALVEIE